MFGIGAPELMVILVVALLVLGPKRLPELARGLGRTLGEFRRATSGITEELDNARIMLEDEVRQAEHKARAESADTANSSPSVTHPAAAAPSASAPAAAAAPATPKEPQTGDPT